VSLVGGWRYCPISQGISCFELLQARAAAFVELFALSWATNRRASSATLPAGVAAGGSVVGLVVGGRTVLVGRGAGTDCFGVGELAGGAAAGLGPGADEFRSLSEARR